MPPAPPIMPAPGRVPATLRMRAPGAKVSPADLTMRVAIALLKGFTLITPKFVTGRYGGPGAPKDTVAFACCDRAGLFVPITETEEHAISLWETSKVTRIDWTAFGAARALVANEPAVVVLSALARSGAGRGV